MGHLTTDTRGPQGAPTPLWHAATGRFDPARLHLAIVARGWTADEFAMEADCGRTSVYKALQGKGVRDATAIAILRALTKREPSLSLTS